MATVEMTGWFSLNEDYNDLENVILFLEKLPNNLEYIIQQESFINLVNEDSDYKIDHHLFTAAFKEAETLLSDSIISFKRLIKLDTLLGSQAKRQAEAYLEFHGFTGSSLQLKARILDKFWKRIMDAADGIIDFASNPIIKLLRKFLNYLNSILGSLTDLIPGIDAVKEIKEAIESYLDLGEELD